MRAGNFLNKLWNANNFLIQNKCIFKNSTKHPKTKININKWIYSELLEDWLEVDARPVVKNEYEKLGFFK